jgi:hypothetical protein
MQYYQLANPDQMRRLSQTGADHFMEYRGSRRIRFCSPEYLQKCILEHIRNGDTKGVTIQTENPTAIHRGEITGQTICDDVTTLHCAKHDGMVDVPLKNIVWFVV